MRIDGNTGPGTYVGREAAANARSSSEQMGSAVQAARQTALSALTNERFGLMLERISDPRSSEALMLMSQSASHASDASVFSSYAEFGD